jgi:hypothetical protein
MNHLNHQISMSTVILTLICVGLFLLVFLNTDHSHMGVSGRFIDRPAVMALKVPEVNEIQPDEQRIARHFEADTLPGLIRRGLVKKYERHLNGTKLFVAGEVWKQRSRFFKESLLAEALVYNKVHGYSLETQVIDHCSLHLYARAVSADRKEFFD